MKACRRLVIAVLFLTLAFPAPTATLYVNLNSGNPTAPYATWATAATNIQDAVDAAVASDEIIVTNGIYATGARTLPPDTTTNRVALNKAVAVRSVNGPQFTVIQGYQVPGTTNGTSAIRCVALTDGASLSGFTLTNGATRSSGFGGGVRCFSPAAAVSNCVLVGNSAAFSSSYSGGGSFSGTLTACTLTRNSAGNGGGASGGVLNQCTLIGNVAVSGGGGAKGATLNYCVVSNNSASDFGGGAYGGTLNGCMLMGNSANQGGGAYSSTLNNCTVRSNTAGTGGGAYGATLNNCIVVENLAVDGANSAFSTLAFSCTTPDPGGIGNLTNAPLFVNPAGGDFHLQASSPCINSGNNSFVAVNQDFGGNPRVISGTVDIGAYEFQGAGSRISYAWLQKYGLPTDGSADFLDPDGDSVNNWNEWRCETDPTNRQSVLKVTSVGSASGMTVSWPSATDRSYCLERTTNWRPPRHS